MWNCSNCGTSVSSGSACTSCTSVNDCSTGAMENADQGQAPGQVSQDSREAEAAAKLLEAIEESGSDEEEVKDEGKEEAQEEVKEEVQKAEAKDRKYCYCNGPGTGRMVACDGKRCAREWFHFRCIGIKTAPTTKKWYCDDCMMFG